jgi:4-methylaminobutanoate oxidase (formaldehyde-forming)
VVLEHQTTRTSAGLFDESSFAKIEISGARAGEFLNYVAANDVVRGENRAVYTQLLNSRGGIEADVTITAIAPNKYLLITGTASGRHDLTWLRKIAAEKKFTELNIEDVTENYAVFGIWGPKAREIMTKIVDIDLSHKAFPFARSLPAKIAGIDLRMTRITYVGELGWEVYVSTKIPGAPLKVWEAMANAAAPFGALPCGYRAIESLRLEKGYRAWGVEISTETTPFEAGLGFAVSLTKPDFLGKKSLLEKVEPKRTLVALTFDEITQVPFGKEPIRKGEKIIGQIKSGGQGFTINKAIGYAYLPIQDAKDGDTVDVEFFGQWIPAKISQHVLFDPQNERVRS